MFEIFEAAEPEQHYKEAGEKLLRANKVACLLLAGGQGTRLGSQYVSKGFYPVSLLKKRSLFAIFAGKVKAASEKWGVPLQCAIMTSPLNHEEIVAYFEKERFFGLLPEQIAFFQQPLLPFLDENEQPLAEGGPCGNGVAIRELFASGIGKKWQEAGIECFTTVLIDNALADPFSADLIGFHEERQLSALVTKRRNEAEKVGIYVRDKNRVKICEYMECCPSEWPKHHFANLSHFCFSLSFAAAHQKTELPLHKVKKGSLIKCEYFIIDFVALADSFHALFCPRELCFAPLKNSEGDDSIVSVQQALQQRDRLRWQELFSVDPEDISFELSPKFYYPEDELLVRYKGQKPLENSYIE